MEGFYEKYREESNILARRNSSHIFRSHFHSNMEILIVNKGGYKVYCNERSYEVADGCIAVFDSYDVHRYDCRLSNESEEDNCVLIVPYRLLTAFNAKRREQTIVSPIIQDKALTEKLLSLIDEYVCADSQMIRENAVGLILALIIERLEFQSKEKRTEVGLMRKILSFVQENFQTDASLATLAKELGYTEEHISRVFRRFSGESLLTYVNRLRLSYIDEMLENGNTERKMSELVFEAGFKSQQTYYRCRKEREKGKTT